MGRHLAMVTVLLTCQSVLAQSGNEPVEQVESAVDSSQARQDEMTIVPLEHAKADQVIDVLSQLGLLWKGLNAVKSPAGNAIILRIDADEVGRDGSALMKDALHLIERIDVAIDSAPRSDLDSTPKTSQFESSLKSDIPESAWSVIRDYHAALHEYRRKSVELGDGNADLLPLRSELAVLQARYVVAARLLSSQIFGGRVKVESHKETLTILLKGPEDDVRKLQQLLDAAKRADTAPVQGNSPAKRLSDLRQAYEQAEREAANLAQRIHQGEVPDEEQAKALHDAMRRLEVEVKGKDFKEPKDVLHALIRRAFDLRMQWQQTQLAEAEANLKLARERLARREQIKDKIIARRLEELISSEDTSWQGTPSVPQRVDHALPSLSSAPQARSGTSEAVDSKSLRTTNRWRELSGMSLWEASSDATWPTEFRGVLQVNKVDTGSPADIAGVQARDLLVGIGKWETISLDGLAYIVGQIEAGSLSRERLKFYIIRDGRTRSGTLRLKNVGSNSGELMGSDAGMLDNAARPQFRGKTLSEWFPLMEKVWEAPREDNYTRERRAEVNEMKAAIASLREDEANRETILREIAKWRSRGLIERDDDRLDWAATIIGLLAGMKHDSEAIEAIFAIAHRLPTYPLDKTKDFPHAKEQVIYSSFIAAAHYALDEADDAKLNERFLKEFAEGTSATRAFSIATIRGAEHEINEDNLHDGPFYEFAEANQERLADALLAASRDKDPVVAAYAIDLLGSVYLDPEGRMTKRLLEALDDPAEYLQFNAARWLCDEPAGRDRLLEKLEAWLASPRATLRCEGVKNYIRMAEQHDFALDRLFGLLQDPKWGLAAPNTGDPAELPPECPRVLVIESFREQPRQRERIMEQLQKEKSHTDPDVSEHADMAIRYLQSRNPKAAAGHTPEASSYVSDADAIGHALDHVENSKPRPGSSVMTHEAMINRIRRLPGATTVDEFLKAVELPSWDEAESGTAQSRFTWNLADGAQLNAVISEGSERQKIADRFQLAWISRGETILWEWTPLGEDLLQDTLLAPRGMTHRLREQMKHPVRPELNQLALKFQATDEGSKSIRRVRKFEIANPTSSAYKITWIECETGSYHGGHGKDILLQPGEASTIQVETNDHPDWIVRVRGYPLSGPRPRSYGRVVATLSSREVKQALSNNAPSPAPTLGTVEEVEEHVKALIANRQKLDNYDICYRINYTGDDARRRTMHIWRNGSSGRYDDLSFGSDGNGDATEIMTDEFSFSIDRVGGDTNYNVGESRGLWGTATDLRRLGLIAWWPDSFDTHEFTETLLPESRKNAKVEVREIDGRQLTVVTFDRENDKVTRSRGEYWLYPAQANMPVFLKSAWRDKEGTEEGHCQQSVVWKQYDGVWFPASIDFDYISAPKRRKGFQLTTQSVRFNLNPFPDVFTPESGANPVAKE